MFWLPPLMAGGVALLCLQLLLSDFGRRLALDRPNERSLHQHPVPRTGGVAIFVGVAAGCLFGVDGFGLSLGVAATLAAISFVDDLLGLGTAIRFALHLAGAAVVVLLDLHIHSWIPFLLLMLAITWYANLYNFMDGSDGLAGGMAVIGFGTYAVASGLAGAYPLAKLCLLVAAASGAFLTRNFYPAKIFMGDVGSVPLGFLAGAFGLIGWKDNLWPIWFPVVVFAPFVFDSTLTLVKRAMRGERVWRAHREHYYQKLVQMGFGHRGTATAEYAFMLVCAGTALVARKAAVPLQLATLIAVLGGLVAIGHWVDIRWTQFERRRKGT